MPLSPKGHRHNHTDWVLAPGAMAYSEMVNSEFSDIYLLIV
jgi:hypothetical protein